MELELIRVAGRGLPGGAEFWVRPGTSDAKALQETIERNTYQKRGVAVAPGDAWADMGANIGGFTVMAAMLGARVVAYEPEPNCAALLKRNVAHNGVSRLVEVVGAAVVPDGYPGELVSLNVNAKPLQLRRHSILKARRGSAPLDVPAVRFSDAAAGRSAKVNIEGAEIGALVDWPGAGSPQMAVEWSFDIDNRIPTLRAAFDSLSRIYSRVEMSRRIDWDWPIWRDNWFPPNLFIYATGLRYA